MNETLDNTLSQLSHLEGNKILCPKNVENKEYWKKQKIQHLFNVYLVRKRGQFPFKCKVIIIKMNFSKYLSKFYKDYYRSIKNTQLKSDKFLSG